MSAPESAEDKVMVLALVRPRLSASLNKVGIWRLPEALLSSPQMHSHDTELID